MSPLPRLLAPALALLSACLIAPALADAASLDLSTDVRMRYYTYGNLEFDPNGGSNQAFISEAGKLAVTLKNIYLAGPKGQEQKVDIGLVMSAYGIGGSTVPVQPPFDKAAARLPTSNLTPFIAGAYVHMNDAFGSGVEATAGRFPFTLGSGMVVSDDGVGFNGLALKTVLDWKQVEVQAFAFEAVASQTGNTNLDLYGAQASLPLEAKWQLSEVVQRERGGTTLGLPMSTSIRSFTGLRYAIERSNFSFDGELVLQRGSATPQDPTLSHIAYGGSAYRMEGRWRQGMGRLGDATMRLFVGHGSGTVPGSTDSDNGFLPARGHRYDGLDRDGYGDVLGASLYDILSTTGTANGLPAGASGIRLYGLGASVPIRDGWMLGVNYYFYFADRVTNTSSALARELDVSLEKHYGPHFGVVIRQGLLTALAGLSPAGNTTSRSLMAGAFARF